MCRPLSARGSKWLCRPQELLRSWNRQTANLETDRGPPSHKRPLSHNVLKLSVESGILNAINGLPNTLNWRLLALLG